MGSTSRTSTKARSRNRTATRRGRIISVGQVRLLAWCLVGAGCGRLHFDPVGASDATGDAASTLSCDGLAPTCGPAGDSPCCGSPLVPGGTFYRGYDVGTDGSFPDMTNPATVSDFRLDTYDVTVGRFRPFVNAGMGTQANPPATGAGARTLNGMASQGGWDAAFTGSLTANTAALVAEVKYDASYCSWTDTAGANESLPMNCITWFEAMAFCAWDGGFLPTEAEWNYVATAGSEQRAYPWSSPASSLTIDCSYANYYTGTAYCVNPPTGAVNRVGSESPKSDGKWGQADLAGNVYEWTLDWYATPYVNPCIDCSDLTTGGIRVLSGGSFEGNAFILRAANTAGADPTERPWDSGVRCARAP